MSQLPLFPVTTVGSWPRSEALLAAQKEKQAGRLSIREFDVKADEAVRAVIELQEEIGIDIVTDGEQRRDNFYSFVSEKLDGVELMTLSEMLDIVEDKVGFEKLLQSLDVPAFLIRNPTAVGRVSRRSSLSVEEARFAKSVAAKPLKVPLPGPYLLTRAMWVPEATGAHYGSKEELGEEVVGILRTEVEELIREGVEFIQFDEPVLTELVFTQGNTRTFMCAALATRRDPSEELEFAVGLMNRVLEPAKGVRTGLHLCRGNWSQDESTLLSGSYRPLTPYFERINVDQFVLEYATPRAGDLVTIPGRELGLGVVNPRTPEVESPDQIISRVEDALQELPMDKLFLNPDCGFATFSSRPMNATQVATDKMRAVVSAAKTLRARAKSQAAQSL